MNRTINDLTATLAGALGAPHQLVEETARHFHEAGMLPDGDAPLDSEHCAILLIGVMRSPSPERSPEMVRLYGELPFERITRNEAHAARRDRQGAILAPLAPGVIQRAETAMLCAYRGLLWCCCSKP